MRASFGFNRIALLASLGPSLSHGMIACCRELWHGADLAGGGKKRALWNAALLVDGVAPAYIQVGR